MSLRSIFGTIGLVRAAAAVVYMVLAWPLHAADFFVELSPGMTAAQRAALKKDIKVEAVKSVPSLGRGVEIWRSSESSDSVQKILESHSGVSLHGNISGDYRDLFTDLGAAMDLAPDVAKNLAAIRQRLTTAEVRAVLVKPDALNARMLANGFDQTDGFSKPGTVRLNLFPNVNVVVVRQQLTRHGANNFDWTGVVMRMATDPVPNVKADASPDTNIPKGIATLSVENGNILGRVNVGSDTYTITPLGKGFHAITKLDSRKFPPEHPPSQKALEKRKSTLDVRGDAPRKNTAPLSNSDGTVNDVAPNPIITVGVAYTNGAAASLGAVSPQQFADALINTTNTSYQNSQVGTKLALAGTTVIDFSESDWDSDMELLKHPIDAPLTDLHKWRHSVGANVVVLLVSLNSFCGLSGNILANVDDAFAMVSEPCALDNLSFAHEIGHLQGARHDEASDPTDSPFRYGHGYRYKSQWRTIMAYDCDIPCPRLPYWANPNVKMNGIPMGTLQRNYDAKVLTDTAASVHGFSP